MNYIYLILGSTLFGSLVFGGKILTDMGASLFEIMVYPSAVAAIAMIFAARGDYKKIISVPLSITCLFFVTETIINLGQYAPISFGIPVSLIVLLLYLQPLWTILIERFFFGQKQSWRNWILVGIMLCGMIILINPKAVAHLSVWGILIAILGGIGLSLWVLLSQYYSRRGISPAGTLFAVSLYAIIPLSIIWPILHYFYPESTLFNMNFDLSGRLTWAILIYGIVAILLPNLLLYKSNKNIPAPVIGMILLLEPVTGVALDVIFLNTPLTPNILIGGGIILISTIILSLPHNHSEAPHQNVMPTRAQQTNMTGRPFSSNH